MLTDKQIAEIKEHLEKTQNPVFFFDNDNDGLASFLLLRRFIDRGKGVPIKSYPELNVSYYRKIEEFNSDYIFILDKPVISQEFLNKAKKDNIPVVWIDHHQTEGQTHNYDNPGINYYNPYLVDKTNEPVSYISYKATNKKEDIWIAVIGCISDCYLPDFYSEFEKKFPELGKKNPKEPKPPFDVLYNSEIGKIARILDFSLKDNTTNVMNMIRFLTKAKGPMDILEENSKTKQILKRYNEINSKYQVLLNKAREKATSKLIFFQYGGDLSLSANLANQLSYEYSEKVIVIAYIKGDIVNISLRSNGDVRKMTLLAIDGIEGASGGGHRNATGAIISFDKLPIFKERIEKLVKKM